MDHEGTIRIAPAVLSTIVSLTALHVPGVTGLMGEPAGAIQRLLRRGGSASGVKIDVRNETTYIELQVIVRSGVNMLDLGARIQREVTEAVRTMAGMPVAEVNIYIQGVSD